MILTTIKNCVRLIVGQRAYIYLKHFNTLLTTYGGSTVLPAIFLLTIIRYKVNYENLFSLTGLSYILIFVVFILSIPLLCLFLRTLKRGITTHLYSDIILVGWGLVGVSLIFTGLSFFFQARGGEEEIFAGVAIADVC